MPEILTESFCERCGTRYTFESVAPRKTKRLGQFKTLSRGVKNWVMSDDSSLDEALAAARGDEERELTAQQLDAFHSTFNFCMNCRQYTCANCWNAVEGRCLSCAPNLGHEVLPAPFPDATAFEPIRMDAEAWPEIDLAGSAAANAATIDLVGLPGNGAGNGSNGHVGDGADAKTGAGEAGDAADLPDIDAAARLAFLAGDEDRTGADRDAPARTGAAPAEAAAPAAGPDPATAGLAWPDDAGLAAAVGEPAIDVNAVADAATGAEAAAATGAGAAAATGAAPAPVVDAPTVMPVAPEPPMPEDTDGRAAALAARTSDLLGRFRPGQNIDAELEAYEAQLEAEAARAAALQSAAPAATPEITAAVEPESSAPLEPGPVAADAAPEPLVAEPAPQAVPETATEPAPGPVSPPVRDDVVPQPTWRIYAPDQGGPATGQPGTPGPATPGGIPLQASADPQWPARPEIDESPSMALLANRARTSSDQLWAASAREVLGGPVGAAESPAAGIQPCSNCGLSLSATARFCRRCGSRQG